MITMSLRVDDETMARLEDLAQRTERSKTWLLKRALEEYLDNNLWQVAEIHGALREADAGDLVDHEAVVAEWERRLADSLDPTSRP